MTLRVGIQWVISMDLTVVGLTIMVPILVVGFLFSAVYTMQWLTSFLFSSIIAIDDIYYD